MNPFEHGEVFVLDDGGEVDMDFGHYERFLGVNCKSKWNLTMGKVFDMIRRIADSPATVEALMAQIGEDELHRIVAMPPGGVWAT